MIRDAFGAGSEGTKVMIGPDTLPGPTPKDGLAPAGRGWGQATPSPALYMVWLPTHANTPDSIAPGVDSQDQNGPLVVPVTMGLSGRSTRDGLPSPVGVE